MTPASRRIKAISEKKIAVRRKTATKPTGTKKPVADRTAPKKSASPKNNKRAKVAVKKTAAKTKTVAKSKISVKPKVSAAKKTNAKSTTARAPKPADQWSLNLLKMIEKSLDADKAEDIVTINLAGKSAIADFMVIATGRNSRQLAAMAHHIVEKLAKAGAKPLGIEGISQGDWVLVDGNDVIIHLFRPDIRKLYGLEKMWGIDQPEPEMLQAVG